MPAFASLVKTEPVEIFYKIKIIKLLHKKRINEDCLLFSSQA